MDFEILSSGVKNSTLCGKISSGDTVFVVFNSLFLLFMLSGFSFFYGGLTHPRSSVTMQILPFFSVSIVSLQWWAIGHSLAFSKSGSPFVGDFSHVFLQGVFNDQYPGAECVPELIFSCYQCITAMIPVVVLLGVISERGRVLPALIFVFLWTTFVYDIICCWSLNPRGWSFRMGIIDYGGASPVHVPAGIAALAYSMFLEPPPRHSTGSHRSYSMNQVVLGTVFIWLGSYGNMAGAAMSVNMPSILASISVTLAGSAGSLTWSLLDYCSYGKLTAIGYCCGLLASLVAITPCAGFVSPASSIMVGIVSALACNLASRIKEKYHLNDVLDVFVLHGVGGIVGSILAGILSQKRYGGSMMEQNSGWLDGNWIQVPIQLLDLFATSFWSFTVSYIILFAFSKIPSLKPSLKPEVSNDSTGISLDETEVKETSFEVQIVTIFDNSVTKFLVVKSQNSENGV